MATAPSFAATPAVASALASGTLDTSLTAPTNVATLISGGTNGTKVEEVVFQAVGSSVAGVINLFLYDGSTYHLYDQFAVILQTSSTTASAWRATRSYANLIVKSGWSLRFTVTIAGLQSIIKGTATGGDF